VRSANGYAPYLLANGDGTEKVVYRFSLEKQGRVEVSVFDTEGRRHARLINRRLGAGEHYALWDGMDEQGRMMSPGLYLIILKRDRSASTR
jgi:flagellar hook assembly protein FlgD